MANNDLTKNDVVIELNNVTKTYPGGTVGIKDLSLQIHRGEIFGFLGQNGAGKTTCIRCILNILIPEEGEIEINGQKVNRKSPELREDIGYLPGELNIPTYYSVKDFLYYMASLRERPASRMMEIVDLFDLPLEKKINELSKGNKQKVGLVIAFMCDPDILILDEPTSGLDPIYQQILYEIILQETERGKTIFFSSHNLDEVQRICDRVGIIREGSLTSIEMVKGLADKIPRKIKAVIDGLSESNVQDLESDFEISTVNYQLEEVELFATTMEEVWKIMNRLAKITGVRDISYPPASLETYFLRKYQED